MTQPTPPPTPALPPPDALAPVSAHRGARPARGLADRGPPGHGPARRAAGRGADGGVFHGPDPQPAHTRGVRHGRDAILYLVRRTRARAREQISPIAVATYIDEMQGRYRAPTIKQHLASNPPIQTIGWGSTHAFETRALADPHSVVNGRLRHTRASALRRAPPRVVAANALRHLVELSDRDASPRRAQCRLPARPRCRSSSVRAPHAHPGLCAPSASATTWPLRGRC